MIHTKRNIMEKIGTTELFILIYYIVNKPKTGILLSQPLLHRYATRYRSFIRLFGVIIIIRAARKYADDAKKTALVK